MLTLTKRIVIAGISTVLMFSIYTFIALTGMEAGVSLDLLTELDTMIPFIPEMVWVYVSYIPLLLYGLLKAEEKPLFYGITSAMVVSVVIASGMFLAFPAIYPRPDILFQTDNITMLAMWLVYYFDNPINCFPSLHVALSWVIALFYKRHKKPTRFVLMFWALAISVSVLFVKQHFLLDVGFGYVVASFSYWFVTRFYSVVGVRVEEKAKKILKK